jgi:hypothetical protein
MIQSERFQVDPMWKSSRGWYYVIRRDPREGIHVEEGESQVQVRRRWQWQIREQRNKICKDIHLEGAEKMIGYTDRMVQDLSWRSVGQGRVFFRIVRW